jgi:hypothetical protein
MMARRSLNRLIGVVIATGMFVVPATGALLPGTGITQRGVIALLAQEVPCGRWETPDAVLDVGDEGFCRLSSAGGYELQIPRDWGVSDHPSDDVEFGSRDGSATVQVARWNVEALDALAVLNRLVSARQEIARAGGQGTVTTAPNGDAVYVSLESAESAAMAAVIMSDESGPDLLTVLLVAKRGTTAYVVTLNATPAYFDAHTDQILHMLTSFRLT